MTRQRRGCLASLWTTLFEFVGRLFHRASQTLPVPVTATTRPTSLAVTLFTTPPAEQRDESFHVVDHPGPPPPPLPSPWSPVGKATSSQVWMSVQGFLVDATGPVVDSPTAKDVVSISSASSDISALDALGISVFVNLEDPVTDDPQAAAITPAPHTPPKRRETISVVPPGTSHSMQATKRFSTPLAKLNNNVGLSHVRSATSISSLAYEFRMGLFADGRTMTALENIISLLDQASPDAIRAHEDTTQPVVAG